MENFQTRYIKSLSKVIATRYISTYDGNNKLISPAYMTLINDASARFSLFSLQADGIISTKLVTEPGQVSSSQLKDIISSFTEYSSSILLTAQETLNDYINNTNKYAKICQRFLYNSQDINNKLNSLLNYSTTYIDIIRDSYFPNTNTYTIGDFVTLPFCINNVTSYNSLAYTTASSLETINYTNASDISSLPLTTPILIKYQSSTEQNLSDLVLQCAIQETTCNVIYIKTYGDVEEIKLDLIYNNNIIYSSTQVGSEALYIFDPKTINAMQFTISVANYNIMKQASLEISEIVLLSNVKFSRQADFETNQVQLTDWLNLNTININAVDYTNSNETYFQKYASVSFDSSENSKSFFQVDSYTGASVAASKITQTSAFQLDSSTSLTDNQFIINSQVASTSKSISALFYKMSIDPTVNYQQGRLLLGTNEAYGMNRSGASLTDNIYENWTKVDNYYRTMLLNNEPNVFIDIGSNQIKINNNTVSGVIKIPTGISVIDVHQSLFDPTFGGVLDSTSQTQINTGLNTDTHIYGDNLFPNNFIYKLAGLPSYSNSVIQSNQQIVGQYISGIGIIQPGTPVLPFTVTITGNNSRQYNLHLGTTPVTEGTFTIEPNSGIIRVHSYLNSDSGKEEDTITVTYTKASQLIKPCGFLFNRMAVHLDFKSIYNMMARLGTYDNTFYTYIEQASNKYLLIPDVENTSGFSFLKTYHNRFSFNTFENNVYVSAKLTLITNNSNISPAIKNIYIQGIQ